MGVDTDGLPLRGDGLASEVARRLRAAKRESDLLARMEDHVFALVAQHVRDGPELAGLAHRLHRALTEPPLPGEQLAHLHVSVGVALFPDDADDQPGLLAAADSALLEARRNRQGVRFHRETAAMPASAGIAEG